MRGSAPSPPAREGAWLSFRGHLDPRFVQVAFTFVFLLSVGLLAAGESDVSRGSLLLGASLACVASLAVTWLVPWRRLSPGASAVLPVLDIALIGLAGLDPTGWAVAPLLVLPVLWMAGQFSTAGAVGSGVAATLFYSVPSVLVLGPDHGTLAWSVLIPVAVTALGLALVQGVDRVEHDQAEVRRQRDELDEAALIIEAHRRFSQAILDAVDVGVVLQDHAGAPLAANGPYRALMRQVSPDGPDGPSYVFHADNSTVCPPDELPSSRAIRGDEFDDFMLWVGENPATRKALSVSARTVPGEDGLLGSTLAFHDVTQFMRALRVKDDFVASISHELRTPLTSILGYLDVVLESEALDDENRHFLDVAWRNGDRLNRLVGDILHTAQVEAGSLHIVRSPTDLAELVRDAVETSRPRARSEGLELAAEAPAHLWAQVDAQRIGQVVDNLLSNALKYTIDGSVTVRLVSDADAVQIAVCDTGIGIDARDRERLFTRFFRSRYAEEQAIQGVGLGLGIVQSIVVGHGGRVEVTSEPGRGSEFRVRLPVSVLTDPPSGVPLQRQLADHRGPA